MSENIDWQEEKLAPTLFEEELRRSQLVNEQNMIRERKLTAARNRAAGLDAPQPGDIIFVTLARGIPRRGRAGLRFGREPARVEVVDASDAEVSDLQASGQQVVNRWGAEQILADDSLIKSSRTPAAADAAAAIARAQVLEEEIRALREENARLATARRDARVNAAPSQDGRPNRLRAQEAAGPPPSDPRPPADDDGFPSPSTSQKTDRK